MIDDDPGVGITLGERGQLRDAAPAQHVDRQLVLAAAARTRLTPGSSAPPALRRHHDADGDRARHLLPLGNRVLDLGIVGVDRLHHPEAAGVPVLHLERVTRVLAILV